MKGRPLKASLSKKSFRQAGEDHETLKKFHDLMIKNERHPSWVSFVTIFLPVSLRSTTFSTVSRPDEGIGPYMIHRTNGIPRRGGYHPPAGRHMGRPLRAKNEPNGAPTKAQRSGFCGERTSKETQRGMPAPGRPEWSGLCEDETGGSRRWLSLGSPRHFVVLPPFTRGAFLRRAGSSRPTELQ